MTSAGNYDKPTNYELCLDMGSRMKRNRFCYRSVPLIILIWLHFLIVILGYIENFYISYVVGILNTFASMYIIIHQLLSSEFRYYIQIFKQNMIRGIVDVDMGHGWRKYFFY